MQLTLAELAQKIGASLNGDGNKLITGVQTLSQAGPHELAFLANPTYISQLASTEAGAVILAPQLAAQAPGDTLVMANPYLGFALATQLFDNRPKACGKIHDSAVIAASAKLGANVTVGANAVIGEHCYIGDHCEIGAGVVIGDHCIIGKYCDLRANVTLYHDVVMGDYVRIHSGAVVGADGFGFAPNQGQWCKIAQLGGVRIGNHVEIGANTCIDRGALGNTEIEDYAILDNLIQIAHNVKIGSATAIASNTGISGSTTIGKNCVIGGAVGIAGHLSIADGVMATGMCMITHSIKEAGVYSSGMPQLPAKDWRKNAVRFKQLDDMARRLKQAEKKLEGKE